jgi:hypothetical protein
MANGEWRMGLANAVGECGWRLANAIGEYLDM